MVVVVILIGLHKSNLIGQLKNMRKKRGNVTEPSKKQLELEQSISSISAYNKISKQNKNISKGRESENYYARNIIESGLQKLSKAIQDHIDESLSGKVGVKAVSALFLSQFPDVDVVAFIAFKV